MLFKCVWPNCCYSKKRWICVHPLLSFWLISTTEEKKRSWSFCSNLREPILYIWSKVQKNYNFHQFAKSTRAISQTCELLNKFELEFKQAALSTWKFHATLRITGDIFPVHRFKSITHSSDNKKHVRGKKRRISKFLSSYEHMLLF